MSQSFIRKAGDPGYIVAWRHKYEHEAGKLAEEVMTYGEATARAEALCEQHPEKTFWAERAAASHSNRFYRPGGQGKAAK